MVLIFVNCIFQQLKHVKTNLELVAKSASQNEENIKSANIAVQKLEMESSEPNGQCVDLKTIARGVKAYVKDYTEQQNIPNAVSRLNFCTELIL